VKQRADSLGRIVQDIVTGVGFLRAGVIMRGAAGEVRGLTTAASLWAMAGIGLAVGSGRELIGIGLATLTCTVVAWGEWPLIPWLWRRPRRQTAVDPAGRMRDASSTPVEVVLDVGYDSEAAFSRPCRWPSRPLTERRS
jgi:putative Mg2+ transporter-C (MgtC) family protein